MALGIGLQSQARFVDGHAMPDAGQDVLQPAPLGLVVEHRVAGDHKRARPLSDQSQGVQPRPVIAPIKRGGQQIERSGQVLPQSSSRASKTASMTAARAPRRSILRELGAGRS